MNNHRRNSRKLATRLLTTCLAFGIFSSPAIANDAQTFEIGATDLASALRTYGAQSGRQILFPQELVNRLRSRPVHGRLSPDAALEILLRDTGLRAVETTAGVLTLQAVQPVKIKASYSAQTRSLASATDRQPVADAGFERSSEADEIVVTARRREEKLQDVPQAITALSSVQLERAKIGELTDIVKMAPGLVAQPSAFGSRSLSLTLRGQRQNLVALTYDPSVIVYFAEIPSMRMIGANAAIYDLESVQVLKGPQGTLFGRNTTGGALLLTPKKPGDEFGGYLTAGIGNYNAFQIEGAVDVPLSDAVQVRVSGRHSEHSGYIKTLGRPGSANDDNTDAVRLSVNIEPSDTITNITVIDYVKQNGTGEVGFLLTCDVSNFPAGFVKTRVSELCAELPARDGKSFYSSPADYNKDGADISALVISNITTVELGAITIKNIMGYRDLDAYLEVDLDGGATDILRSGDRNQVKQYTEELQILGNALDDNLSYQFGGFYFRESAHDNQQTPTLGNISIGDFDALNISRSIYGQITYKIPSLEGLSVTAGARETWDRRKMVNRGRQGPVFETAPCRILSTNVAGSPVISPCSKTVSTNFSAFTYNASLDWKLGRNALVYLATRRGYRSGGFLSSPRSPAEFEPYEPEVVTDYELGLKTEYWLGAMRGRTNIAGYIGNFKNAQRNITTSVPDNNDPSVIINKSVIFNAQKARISGFEIEQMLRPADFLELNLSYAYTDAKYLKFLVPNVNSATGFDDYTAAPFAGVPKHALSGNVSVTVPLSGNSGTIVATMSGSYLSKAYAGDLQGYSLATKLTDDRAIVPGYHSFDARLDWQNALGSNFTISGWVRNLTAEHYAVGGSYTSGLGYSRGIFNTPRTYGIDIKAEF